MYFISCDEDNCNNVQAYIDSKKYTYGGKLTSSKVALYVPRTPRKLCLCHSIQSNHTYAVRRLQDESMQAPFFFYRSVTIEIQNNAPIPSWVWVVVATVFFVILIVGVCFQLRVKIYIRKKKNRYNLPFEITLPYKSNTKRNIQRSRKWIPQQRHKFHVAYANMRVQSIQLR